MLYITHKTQSLAPAGSTGSPTGWVHAKWEVFMTSDEPFFEFGKKLVEGNTYAFRVRARNSAGYGGYSEVWVVEVI